MFEKNWKTKLVLNIAKTMVALNSDAKKQKIKLNTRRTRVFIITRRLCLHRREHIRLTTGQTSTLDRLT
jgi:hypothetical protein